MGLKPYLLQLKTTYQKFERFSDGITRVKFLFLQNIKKRENS